MMRCLYLTSVYPCLSETFIAREIKHLSLLGWKVHVFRIKGKERFVDENVPDSHIHLHPVMLNPFYWVRGVIWALQHRRMELAEMFAQMRNLEADIHIKVKLVVILLVSVGIAEYVYENDLMFEHIRANFLHTEAISAYWLSKLLRVPYSITVHTRMTYYPKSLVKNVVACASFCISISTDSIDLLRQFQVDIEKIYLIRSGIEIDALRNREKIVPPVPIVLAVGRLIPKKGFDILIQACAVLVQKGIEFECRIVGAGSEHSKLTRLIDSYNLGRYVRLLGALSFNDVVHQYQTASIFVAPSRVCHDDVDGLPGVITEALAMRIPVIATPVAGIPDLIHDKSTGLIVPPNDSKSLANAIDELIVNKQLRQLIAVQGQKSVIELFDISKTVKSLHVAMLNAQDN